MLAVELDEEAELGPREIDTCDEPSVWIEYDDLARRRIEAALDKEPSSIES